MRRSKGFSLVELLVVIAIMSIVTSISFGCISMVRKATIKSATTNLGIQIERAKSKALMLHEDNTFFRLFSDGTNFYAAVSSENGGKISNAPCISLGKSIRINFRTSTGSHAMTWTSPMDGQDFRIYFDRRSGSVSNVTGTIGVMAEDSFLNDADTDIYFEIELANGDVGSKTVRVNIANGTVIQ